MRIISGQRRGQRIQTLKGAQLRPTSDQMRETLFDVLGPSVLDSTFLDAYAGSGAVGLEALSRGAKEVVFVEHHRAASDLIRRNLAALKMEDGFYLMNTKVLTAIERLDEEGSPSILFFSTRLTAKRVNIITCFGSLAARAC